MTAPAKQRAYELLGRLALLFLSSYGLLYFSYKFLMPWSGTNDFTRYYPMYLSPLHFSVAPSPWVLRQVSAVLTHLVWKAHIYYPNQIWFQDPAYDQHVFFAALFTNWICLVLTALLAGVIAENLLGQHSFFTGAIAGFLCILSFHTQFVVISGITEGVSWLLLAIAFLAYLKRAEWSVLLVLLLAILQREALLVAMASIAGLDLLRDRHRDVFFRLRIILYACLCLAVYVVLRRYVPGNDHQVHIAGVVDSLKDVQITRAMLTLSFLNQNVILIALAARLLLRRRSQRHNGTGWIGILVATFAVVAFGALCAGLDVDIGRIAGITIPLFAASAAADLTRLNQLEILASPTGFEPVLPP